MDRATKRPLKDHITRCFASTLDDEDMPRLFWNISSLISSTPIDVPYYTRMSLTCFFAATCWETSKSDASKVNLTISDFILTFLQFTTGVEAFASIFFFYFLNRRSPPHALRLSCRIILQACGASGISWVFE